MTELYNEPKSSHHINVMGGHPNFKVTKFVVSMTMSNKSPFTAYILANTTGIY